MIRYADVDDVDSRSEKITRAEDVEDPTILVRYATDSLNESIIIIIK